MKMLILQGGRERKDCFYQYEPLAGPLAGNRMAPERLVKEFWS